MHGLAFRCPKLGSRASRLQTASDTGFEHHLSSARQPFLLGLSPARPPVTCARVIARCSAEDGKHLCQSSRGGPCPWQRALVLLANEPSVVGRPRVGGRARNDAVVHAPARRVRVSRPARWVPTLIHCALPAAHREGRGSKCAPTNHDDLDQSLRPAGTTGGMRSC